MRYEVDLRERKTGSSVITIYAAWDLDEAWKIINWYNENHLDDYDPDTPLCDYIDESKDGFVADCYCVDSIMKLKERCR